MENGQLIFKTFAQKTFFDDWSPISFCISRSRN